MFRLVILMLVQTHVIACISKEEAIQCFYGVADSNNDGMVTKDELKKAIGDHLPWWQVKAFDFFGGTDRIVRDCDANQDGILTAAEAVTMSDTCLENCFKRTATAHVFDC
jgi:Ca2+-binding EF-hand superfamily protein